MFGRAADFDGRPMHVLSGVAGAALVWLEPAVKTQLLGARRIELEREIEATRGKISMQPEVVPRGCSR
jgi:hypothetical protein